MLLRFCTLLRSFYTPFTLPLPFFLLPLENSYPNHGAIFQTNLRKNPPVHFFLRLVVAFVERKSRAKLFERKAFKSVRLFDGKLNNYFRCAIIKGRQFMELLQVMKWHIKSLIEVWLWKLLSREWSWWHRWLTHVH